MGRVSREGGFTLQYSTSKSDIVHSAFGHSTGKSSTLCPHHPLIPLNQHPLYNSHIQSSGLHLLQIQKPSGRHTPIGPWAPSRMGDLPRSPHDCYGLIIFPRHAATFVHLSPGSSFLEPSSMSNMQAAPTIGQFSSMQTRWAHGGP